ncbi:hypothetical protein E4U57_001464 [Claviceps arundinis]|uniref:Uncharacterized protein n=1 Tax=Claviceps arundinis TaxID=1623583 RepID=A0A9P7MQ37_9HYPO|nr:hypothetical protein E4U57_001464 [Claviceps arundinis]KAG5964373.1 hypothetical protein E4U56_002291 [Claviceps arundinis]
MQLISALLMVAAASVASAAAFAPYGWQRFTGHERFCDHGTHGDGGCEKNGKHTYCCQYQEELPAFAIMRQTTALSATPDGDSNCVSGNGQIGMIYCA